MNIDIGINEKNREEIAKLLNVLLADEYVLYVQTQNYHWNVSGEHFYSFHKFFEDQYEKLSEVIDGIAERVRQLGEIPFSTLKEFIKHARLKEYPGDVSPAEEMLKNLLEHHEIMIQNLRKEADLCLEKFKDAGTNDFLVGIMEKHEKIAWMLRSSLEKG